MNSIESKVRTYWAYKNPYVYYFQFITFPICFVLWFLSFLFGVLLLSEEITIGMLFWTLGWFFGGVLIFKVSFWYRVGVQKIKIEKAGIRVTKKFMFIEISKNILKHDVNSVTIKKFEPFNYFTGKEIKTNVEIGWLIINNDRNYTLNSYLFPIQDLEWFRKQLIVENFNINQ